MQFRLLKLGLCNRCNIKFQILAPELLHVTSRGRGMFDNFRRANRAYHLWAELRQIIAF